MGDELGADRSHSRRRIAETGGGQLHAGQEHREVLAATTSALGIFGHFVET